MLLKYCNCTSLSLVKTESNMFILIDTETLKYEIRF